jgi:hypothetical protein
MRGSAATDNVAMLLGARDPVINEGWLEAVFATTLVGVAIAAELVNPAEMAHATSSKTATTGPRTHSALAAQ